MMDGRLLIAFDIATEGQFPSMDSLRIALEVFLRALSVFNGRIVWDNPEIPSSQAAHGFAFTTPDGKIIINSVAETPDQCRLRAGEGTPVSVVISRDA